MKNVRNCSTLSLVPFCLALSLAALPSQAASFTWNGSDGDASVVNPLNWVGGVAAPSGSDLVFGVESGGGFGFVQFNDGITFAAPTVAFSPSAPAFTITAGGGSDVLNITGSGVVFSNLSNFRQTSSLITIQAGTQTWDGGSRGLSISAIDLLNNRTLTLTGTGTGLNENEITQKVTGTGTSGIVKSGVGTLAFNNAQANDYTGSTVVAGGTLIMNSANVGTGSYSVDGPTSILQLGASNRIANASNLVLNGGAFATGGFDETVGKLSLTNFSTIDFGASNTSDLVFSLSSDQAWGAFTLNITNFNVGDTLRFGTNSSGLTASQLLNNIRFNGTTAGQIDSNGFITATVVPEPTSALLIGLGLMSVLARRRSRR